MGYIKEKLQENQIENVIILKKNNNEDLEKHQSTNVFKMDEFNTKKITMFN
jgi:hypothetical protein